MIPVLRRLILPKLTSAQRAALGDLREGQILYDSVAKRAFVNSGADGGPAVWEALGSAVKRMDVIAFRTYAPTHLEQVVVVDNATTPSWWHEFIYDENDTSSYKWHCLGGKPIIAEAFDIQQIASGPDWSIGTGAPSLAAYRAGEWMFDVHGVASGAGGTAIAMNLQVGGTNPSNDNAIWNNSGGTGGAPQGSGWGGSTDSIFPRDTGRIRRTVTIDDSSVRFVIRTWNGLMQYGYRYIHAMPLRVA